MPFTDDRLLALRAELDALRQHVQQLTAELELTKDALDEAHAHLRTAEVAPRGAVAWDRLRRKREDRGINLAWDAMAPGPSLPAPEGVLDLPCPF